MNLFTDHLGNIISLASTPKRIVSLVPSQTELLYDLGLRDEVAGITKFCIHPEEWLHTKRVVGGTKKVHIVNIHSIKPDLIIANKEENTELYIRVMQKDYPVWVSDIETRVQAYDMMKRIGIMVERKTEAENLIGEIQNGFKEVENKFQYRSALYFIWKDPYMIAGGNTFISDMMNAAGLKNAAAHLNRYPVISPEEISELNPDLLLLSSEPYPFKEKHQEELKSILPAYKTVLVDGEIFSWYGSRMKLAPDYFMTLRKQIEST